MESTFSTGYYIHHHSTRNQVFRQHNLGYFLQTFPNPQQLNGVEELVQWPGLPLLLTLPGLQQVLNLLHIETVLRTCPRPAPVAS